MEDLFLKLAREQESFLTKIQPVDFIVRAGVSGNARVFDFLLTKLDQCFSIHEEHLDDLLQMNTEFLQRTSNAFNFEISNDKLIEKFGEYYQKKTLSGPLGKKLPSGALEHFDLLYSKAPKNYDEEKSIIAALDTGFIEIFDFVRAKVKKPFFLTEVLKKLIKKENFELFDYVLKAQDEAFEKDNKKTAWNDHLRTFFPSVFAAPAVFYERLSQSYLLERSGDFMDAALHWSNKKAFFDALMVQKSKSSFITSKQTQTSLAFCRDPEILSSFFNEVIPSDIHWVHKLKDTFKQAALIGNSEFISFAATQRPAMEFFTYTQNVLDTDFLRNPDDPNFTKKKEVVTIFLDFYKKNPTFIPNLLICPAANLLHYAVSLDDHAMVSIFHQNGMLESFPLRGQVARRALEAGSTNLLLNVFPHFMPDELKQFFYVKLFSSDRGQEFLNTARVEYEKNILTNATQPHTKKARPPKKM